MCSVAQPYPPLCSPMNRSLPDSSGHGIFHARILEWVAPSYSRGSSPHRDQTHVSCIGRWILSKVYEIEFTRTQLKIKRMRRKKKEKKNNQRRGSNFSSCSLLRLPSIRYHASNLDWRLIPYMILYVFQCHSPKSCHPLPLPQSQKTVLYISVSFAVSYTGLLLPSF